MSNSRDNAVADIQGQAQSVLDNTYPGSDKIHNIWTYFSNPPNLQQLQQLLQGQQTRDLGLAGKQASANASAYGLNPYAATQHAQSPIYGQYAKQFTDLPMNLAHLQLLANQGNFENLYKLLSLKSGLAGQRANESGDIGGFVGNALGLGLKTTGLGGWGKG